MTRLGRSLVVVVVLTACAAGPDASDRSAPASEPMSAASPSDASAAPDPSQATASVQPGASAAPEPTEVAWTELDATGPSAREDHTWTVSGDGTTALLFGGRDGSTVHGDLWAYDLATDAWTRIGAPGGPAPRFGHEAAWVDGIGLVIFAGQAGATFFGDLWAFDPASATWTSLSSTGAVPVPRYGSCMALGPDGRLWISHGFTSDGTRFADTRAWDPTTGEWTDETPDGDLPVNRCLHGCWWTDDGRLALFGGQTTGVTALDDRWLLDAGGWSRVDGTQPSPRNLYARVRVGSATLVLGGQTTDGTFVADGWWLVDEGGPAEPLEASGTGPSGRSGAEGALDEARDRLLVFGGRDEGGAYDDLWQLSGVDGTVP